MAAVKLANSATLSGPSSRPRGLLVETMQIVEPKKHPPVPNHLLSSSKLTKLYLCNMLVKFTLRVMHTVDDCTVSCLHDVRDGQRVQPLKCGLTCTISSACFRLFQKSIPRSHRIL